MNILHRKMSANLSLDEKVGQNTTQLHGTVPTKLDKLLQIKVKYRNMLVKKTTDPENDKIVQCKCGG